MALILSLEREEEVLEVLWLVGLIESPVHGWRIRMVTRGQDSNCIKMWELPIGLLPMISPGQCFHRGDRMKATLRGEVRQFRIENIGKGEEVTTSIIPPELFFFYDRQRGVQRLLRYIVGRTEYLIPTIEMIRYLFLHNNTMANALMHPGGIMELFRPERTGFHDKLHLHFRAKMPLSVLSSDFVAEFAWTAIDPEARRSWDSVSTLSIGQKYVSFHPPHLMNSNWTVRSVSWKNMTLVLEINHVTGKRHPCGTLHYSHPFLRISEKIRSDSSMHSGNTPSDFPNTAIIPDYTVDGGENGSRIDVHQSALDIPIKASSFDRAIEIKKVKLRVPKPTDRARGGSEKRYYTGDKKHFLRTAHRRVRVVTSVAEAGVGATLPPIEFRMLDPADPGYLGELKPLIKVLPRISRMFPRVNIAMSLCSLKLGRVFSKVGRHRRACLIAIIWPPMQLPLVLIEVDHSGQFSLSSLLLKYKSQHPVCEIEKHIAEILDALVDNKGHWFFSIIDKSNNFYEYARLPKMMRTRAHFDDDKYLDLWAIRLANHLGLFNGGRRRFSIRSHI